MSETRNLWHLQCAGRMARASSDDQFEYLKNRFLDGANLNTSEELIKFERKFFLPRRQAERIINSMHEMPNNAESIC